MSYPVLNRKVALQTPVTASDGAGGFTTDWQTQGTLWGEMKPGTGREKAVQHMTVTSVPCKITVRAAPEGSPSRPRPEQRFVMGGRVFDILAVTDSDIGGHYLTCFCQEEMSQ